MFVTDFLRELFTSRVEGAGISARGKAWSAQARARSKVASRFNQAVDGGVAKVTSPVKGAMSKRKADPVPGSKTEKKRMGFLFWGRKDKGEGAGRGEPEASGDEKTQAINLAAFEDATFKRCVGWVVVMEGPQAGRDHRLVPGRNRLGTDADMEVVLTDPYVSSHHATIVYTDEGIYQISDAGSTNGTKVNGKRVMQAQIVDNDSLNIGHTELRFKALD
jgi:hypothetical protein